MSLNSPPGLERTQGCGFWADRGGEKEKWKDIQVCLVTVDSWQQNGRCQVTKCQSGACTYNLKDQLKIRMST